MLQSIDQMCNYVSSLESKARTYVPHLVQIHCLGLQLHSSAELVFLPNSSTWTSKSIIHRTTGSGSGADGARTRLDLTRKWGASSHRSARRCHSFCISSRPSYHPLHYSSFHWHSVDSIPGMDNGHTEFTNRAAPSAPRKAGSGRERSSRTLPYAITVKPRLSYSLAEVVLRPLMPPRLILIRPMNNQRRTMCPLRSH